MTTDREVKDKIKYVCDNICKMLIEKNEAYGNSALDPIRVFSKSNTDEQLNVRIDDKLSRVKRGHEYPSDNTLEDLIGYFILKMVYKELEKEKEYEKIYN